MSDYKALLEACHKPFAYYDHEFNPQGHIYIKIQSTVLRLNSLGVPWDWIVTSETIVDNPNKTRQGKDQYDAVVRGQLVIEGLGSRGANGAGTNFDKDNVVKAAGSYALRKAGSLFGISHYLMVRPQENSDLVKHLTGMDMTDLKELKKAVILMAQADGAEPTLAGIKGYYGIKAEISSVEGIINLLTREGRI